MTFDTPIFDSSALDQLYKDLESYDISHRYQRAVIFRNYLSQIWTASGLKPPYFDWADVLRTGEKNFGQVRAAVQKIDAERDKGGRAIRRHER